MSSKENKTINLHPWRFVYDEKINDNTGCNYTGVLTNGKDMLFYHVLPDPRYKNGLCFIFSSIESLMTNSCEEIAYPSSEANDIMLLEALNSLPKGDRTRISGKDCILKEIRFANPNIGMKQYTINVHFDMVVTETVVAENLDEAKEKAENIAAERNLSKYGDCAGVDSCLVSEKEID